MSFKMSNLMILIAIVVVVILLLIIWSCLDLLCRTRWPSVSTVPGASGLVPLEESELVSVIVDRFEWTSSRRSLEKHIFEKSFEAIGRRHPGLSHLLISYLNAYDTCVDGRINWHLVFPELKGGSNAYTPAIRKTSRLLSKCSRHDKNQISGMVSTLIARRRQENESHKHEDKNSYDRHLNVINVWQEFRRAISV